MLNAAFFDFRYERDDSHVLFLRLSYWDGQSMSYLMKRYYICKLHEHLAIK